MFNYTKLVWTRATPDTWTAGGFVITRWQGYCYGYVSQSFCYMVHYNGELLTSLTTWPHPHDLAEAKRQAQQYNHLLAIRAEIHA